MVDIPNHIEGMNPTKRDRDEPEGPLVFPADDKHLSSYWRHHIGHTLSQILQNEPRPRPNYVILVWSMYISAIRPLTLAAALRNQHLTPGRP
jgi:hypothetical protein